MSEVPPVEPHSETFSPKLSLHDLHDRLKALVIQVGKQYGQLAAVADTFYFLCDYAMAQDSTLPADSAYTREETALRMLLKEHLNLGDTIAIFAERYVNEWTELQTLVDKGIPVFNEVRRLSNEAQMRNLQTEPSEPPEA